MALAERDRLVVAVACAMIGLRSEQGWHQIGRTLGIRSGRVSSAVHREAMIGGIAVGAEAVAIDLAAVDGDTAIGTLGWSEVVPPCGMCRELIADAAAEAWVIVPDGDGETVVPVGWLLLLKDERRGSPCVSVRRVSDRPRHPRLRTARGVSRVQRLAAFRWSALPEKCSIRSNPSERRVRMVDSNRTVWVLHERPIDCGKSRASCLGSPVNRVPVTERRVVSRESSGKPSLGFRSSVAVTWGEFEEGA